jgi:hypothetical protein
VWFAAIAVRGIKVGAAQHVTQPVNWRAPGTATSACGCAAQCIGRVAARARPTSGHVAERGAGKAGRRVEEASLGQARSRQARYNGRCSSQGRGNSGNRNGATATAFTGTHLSGIISGFAPALRSCS